MSHSTRSGSKQSSSDHFPHSPPSKQDTLKQTVANELASATWELDATTLARALSSKKRKVGVPPLTIDAVDKLENYDIKIDELDSVLDDTVKALKYEPLPIDTSESVHYQPLIIFLNACVEAFPSVYDNPSYYNLLNFIVFDRLTRDGILGSSPLKPDGAGANGLSSDETELWWRPPSPKRSSTMEIPVEVKRTWLGLVQQAGTYARGLISARPLRQFSLVLAYNHETRALRFLVFHPGGLTASPDLRPSKPEDRKDILRLFLSLLTWETSGDAGLPEWSNDTEMSVQRSEDDQTGLKTSVEENLYESLGIRGRGVKVSRVCPIKAKSFSSTPAAPVVIAATTFHRSARIAEKARKNTEQSSGSRGRGSAHRQSSKRSQVARIPVQSRGQPEDVSEVRENGITLFKVDQKINFVRRQLHDFSQEISQATTDIISKCSWVGKRYVSVESRMLKECGGMFGVATHYHSSIVCHKDGLPATNHLFLNNAEPWPIFAEAESRDYRSLLQHFTQFAGRSLVTVTTPEKLFVAIVHAALGYRNLIERGYQHRDISIGNVLWLDSEQETKSVFETFQGEPSYSGDYRTRLEAELKRCGVSKVCHGFLIDGDMAVEIKPYFMKDHGGSRSGTDEFMSDGLLMSARLDKHYLQSPVDDLWSLYYVAQWAAVFNNTNFPDTALVPEELRELRGLIAGSPTGRDSGTRRVTVLGLDSTEYSEFLADCCPTLREWESKLQFLGADWKKETKVDGNVYDVYYPLFRKFTDRGVLELLELVRKDFMQ